MDDQHSVLSSCYWDATSISSETTIPSEFYHTPTGSLTDMCNAAAQCGCDGGSGKVTPILQKAAGTEESVEEAIEKQENGTIEEETAHQVRAECQLRPPLRKQNAAGSEMADSKSEEQPKKRNWKQELAKRLSFTRSRIIKSFAVHKSYSELRQSKSIFQSVRRSLSRMRSLEKRSKSNKDVTKGLSECTSAVLGSDCDYFIFESDTSVREMAANNSEIHNYVGSDNVGGTPLKPRRQFTQEKYLTGSKELLKKAFNSLKRKSHIHDDKSLLDLCSTVARIFTEQAGETGPAGETDPAGENGPPGKDERMLRTFMDSCVDAFIAVQKQQVAQSLQMINKTVGEHIDLNSKDLDIISKSRKYQLTELFGSKGVCIITDTHSRSQFIALKTAQPRSWIVFLSFLQHLDKDSELLSEQEWVVFPAQSFTNLFVEMNLVSATGGECKPLLDTITQLIVIMYCQRMNDYSSRINPSNVLLVSSDVSVVFVFIESSDRTSCMEPGDWLNATISSDKELRRTYQNSIMELNKHVDRFLSVPANSCHLITASYPLDYLFFLLLKLNKDVGVLLNIM